MTPVVELTAASKRYGPVEALRGVSLAIEPGEIVAVLGPNGAGKTTSISLMLGLRQPTGGQVRLFGLHNEHPEVSWNSLWGKVWYESRQHPEFIWQSSSASSDFEPKFSLTPLAFGTLKGALYALVFAVPFSILGAIYTGFFMSPGMRRIVKPTIVDALVKADAVTAKTTFIISGAGIQVLGKYLSMP